MKSITQDEAVQVMKVAGKTSLRNHAMILVGYLHGMRASEVCQLEMEDVFMDREQMLVRRKKGSISTWADFVDVPGQPLLCESKVLRKWLAERGDNPSPFVFPSQKGACLDRRSFFHIFATAAKEAGLPADKQHCHVLRFVVRSVIEVFNPLRFTQRSATPWQARLLLRLLPVTDNRRAMTNEEMKQLVKKHGAKFEIHLQEKPRVARVIVVLNGRAGKRLARLEIVVGEHSPALPYIVHNFRCGAVRQHQALISPWNAGEFFLPVSASRG